jgi:hypothetical protein
MERKWLREMAKHRAKKRSWSQENRKSKVQTRLEKFSGAQNERSKSQIYQRMVANVTREW